MNKKTLLIIGSFVFLFGVIIFSFASKNTDIWKPSPVSPTASPIPTANITTSAQPSPTVFSKVETSQRIQEAFTSNKFSQTISLVENTNDPSEQDLFFAAQSARKILDYTKARSFIESALKIQNTDEYRIEYTHILLSLGEIGEVKGLLKNIESDDDKTYFSLILALTDEENDTAKTLATELKTSSKYRTVSTAVLDIFDTYDSFSDGSPYYLRTMVANLFKTLQLYNISLAHITPVVENRPDYQDAWRLMGSMYLEMKKFDLAERMFEKSLSLDPTHPQSRYLLGITLAELGQSDDAVDQIEAAIKYGYTDTAKAYGILGDISFQNESYTDALSWYEKSIDEHESVNIGTLSRAVYILIEKEKQPNLALPLLQRAISKSDKTTKQEVLGFKAWVLLEQQKPDEAQTVLSEIEAFGEGKSAIFYLHQGALLEQTNKNEEALESYKKSYEADNGGFIGQEAVRRYNELVEEM